MVNTITHKPDFCIIGGGASGSKFALTLCDMGFTVVLVDSHTLGGNTLRSGALASKALIREARLWKMQTLGMRKNLDAPTEALWTATKLSIQGVIEDVGKNLDDQLLSSQPIKIELGQGFFLNKNTFQVGNKRIQGKRFILASGSSPYIPAIKGIDKIPYDTSETIFDRASLPKSWIIIGGGPIGLEFAQSFQRLGCHVTVIQSSRVLAKDDTAMVDILRQSFKDEGIEVLEEANPCLLEKSDNGGIILTFEQYGTIRLLEAEALFIATGRRANVHGLNLKKAGVAYQEKGVLVDRNFLTTNRRIYAIGDVIGRYHLVNSAHYEVDCVLKHAIYKLPAAFKLHNIPWVTFTDPEFAHIGSQENQLREAGKKFLVYTQDMQLLERSRIEQAPSGKIKVIVDPHGYILGVTIVSCHASELIVPWLLAIQEKIPLHRMAHLVIPYPTLSIVYKKIAEKFCVHSLQKSWHLRVFRCLYRWFN